MSTYMVLLPKYIILYESYLCPYTISAYFCRCEHCWYIIACSLNDLMILANTKHNNNEPKKDRISPLLVDAAEGDSTYAHDLNTLKVHGKIDY